MTTTATPQAPTKHPVPVRARRAAGRSWWRGLVDVVSGVFLVGMVGLVVAVVVAPMVVGGHALTVLTGSMTPTIQPGDVVVVRPVSVAETRVGDVVTFMPRPNDPTLVTHRVVHKNVTGEGTKLVTRGDANGRDDEPIGDSQLVGRLWYVVPKVGHLTNVLSPARGLLVAGLAAGLIGWGVFHMVFGGKQKNVGRRSSGANLAASTADNKEVKE